MEQTPWMRLTERGLYTLLNLLFVLILIFASFSYPYRARLAPLAVGIPTAIFFFIQGLFDWFPRFEQRYRSVEEAALVASELPMASSEEDGDTRSLRFRECALVLWVAGMVLATYLLGILIAMPLFALAYLRLWSGESWLMTVSYSIGTWLAAYLLLIKLLEAQLPVGLLVEWVGL